MPTIVTYFICGFRVSTPTTLAIAVRTDHVPPIPAPDPLPSLRLMSKGHAEGPPIAGKDGGWKIPELAAGDHVLRIDHEELATWPGVALAVTSGAAVTLVTEAVPGEVVGWQATSAKSDPKDPWPPPIAAKPVPNSDWFKTTFDVDNLVLPRAF